MARWTLTPEERFWTKVGETTPGEHWVWLAGKDAYGYGQFSIGNKKIKAHRFAYELLVGPIPPGLTIDHLCKVRHCVNPAHMEPVTPEENVRRSENYWRNRTHCKHGHPFTPDNTYWSRGRRACRRCTADAQRRYVQRKRATA